jgi:hypothetical protein
MSKKAIIALSAAIAALCSGRAAHCGPCTSQIARLEQQIQHKLPRPDSGATAPQTVGAQLHHQPKPGAVQFAERQAKEDAVAALQRARQADSDGDAAACAKAFDEAKHHWILPA